jgi:TatD DNase family protein
MALPIVVHTREAEADTFRILEAERRGTLRGVFHCFTGSAQAARRAVELGFFVSFAGIITFRGAGELRRAAINVPMERLLVETDSPYLSPVPYRGKRNEPCRIRTVVAALAELRGVSAEEMARTTSRNFNTLFNP